MKIKWSGMTHPGRFRKSNQDAFLGLIMTENEVHHLGKEDEYEFSGDSQFIFAVSDGMGGANAGDFASRIAVQTVLKKLPQLLQHIFKLSKEDRCSMLERLFQEIHEEINLAGRYYEECKGMGATLSLIWAHDNGITFGHVGDSRIYVINPGKDIRQISEDHSEVGRLHREGKINERQSKQHPRKHILDQTLGGNMRTVQPQTGNIPFDTGDHLILCSDGICDGLYNRSIEKLITMPPPNLVELRPAERLVKEALFSSGKDNLTAMVVSMETNLR